MKSTTKKPVNGSYKEYFTDGKLSVAGHYKDGQKVGEWKTYDKTGKLKRTKIFRVK